MSSRFTIAGNTTQINFRYRCQQDFEATTVDGDLHIFKQKTILRIDELGDDHAILTYTTFPDKKKIRLYVDNSFEHLNKLIGFST
jgi:hypothetical protein